MLGDAAVGLHGASEGAKGGERFAEFNHEVAAETCGFAAACVLASDGHFPADLLFLLVDADVSFARAGIVFNHDGGLAGTGGGKAHDAGAGAAGNLGFHPGLVKSDPIKVGMGFL